MCSRARAFLAAIALGGALFGGAPFGVLGAHLGARAWAQGLPPGLPPIEVQVGGTAPGVWVRYALVNRRRGEVVLLRLAALERERGGQWFELSFTDPQRRTMITRLLLAAPAPVPAAAGAAGDPAAAAAGRVLRAIVQPPGQAPLILPTQALARQRVPFAAGTLRDAREVGREVVRTAAGKFDTRRLLLGAGAGRTAAGKASGAASASAAGVVWVSDALAGWSVVKARLGDQELELIGRGAQAVSELRGRPLALDPALVH
ncbi:MAG: hypothetical protein IPL40_14180 [Proteobacteria bacterium]|nr:hypothetical protein [Pseudomonadota bacterium]